MDPYKQANRDDPGQARSLAAGQTAERQGSQVQSRDKRQAASARGAWQKLISFGILAPILLALVLGHFPLKGGAQSVSLEPVAASEFRTEVDRGMQAKQTVAARQSERQQPRNVPAGVRPEHGGCRMNGCFWTVEIGRRMLREEGGIRLVALTLMGGHSHHPDGEYPDYVPPAQIDWYKEPYDVFLLCAPQMPSIMIKADDVYQVGVLNFQRGLSGPNEGSDILYGKACHGRSMYAHEMKALYPDEPIEGPEQVSKPTDIFAHLQSKND